MEKRVHLPAGHKFTIYRDEDGDYVLESQQEQGLIVDGADPNEVVMKMAELIPRWETLSELAKGYIANARDARKLSEEFEGVQFEVLSRSEP